MEPVQVPCFSLAEPSSTRSDLSDKQSGAGDRDRTGMASLEGWGSTIELHPQVVRRAKGTGSVRDE